MKLNIEKDRLTLDGEPFYLAAGDIQYFRIHPDEWRQRLVMMKDFGLTAIQTYCAWNLHEPRPGEFDFSDMLDLAEFLRCCDKAGLKVLLRPSPFICGEWEFGGLPWWLHKDRHMRYRCSDPKFLAAVSRYYKKLCAEFVPYLSTNGGPIIAVCIENEYGSVHSDLDYMRYLADDLAQNGVDVPLYLTDPTQRGLAFQKPLGIWMARNYRIESETAIPALKELQPDKPAFVGEYWSGRAVYWGEYGHGREVEPIAKAYRTALDLGAYVCFYMFAGGTNFGFMNGSRIVKPFMGVSEPKFRAITTSYNVDALLTEDGCATEKYYACRRELDEYLGKEVRTYRLPDPEFQTITKVKLTETAPLFENLDVLGKVVKSPRPLTFEELDCGYGFVIYRTELPYGYDSDLALEIKEVRDRAMIFIDGELAGVQMRDREAPVIKVNAEKPHKLDILVENLGRLNTSPDFGGEKGILGDVSFGTTAVCGFDCIPLPMNEFSDLRFGDIKTGKPRFLRGSFCAKGGIPTHLHMQGWGKGFAVINGFNLGRYWCIGPQETLYVPGGLLRDGENELFLFELHDHACDTVHFIDHAILDGAFDPEGI